MREPGLASSGGCVANKAGSLEERSHKDVIDFDQHRELNVPFTITSAEMLKAYDDWCQKQSCKKCGRNFSDRGKDEIWITETLCMECF
jgi:hypothetical protein